MIIVCVCVCVKSSSLHSTSRVKVTPSTGSVGTPPPATPSQTSVAVAAVAIAVIVAVVVGGCLFVVFRNKQRRYSDQDRCEVFPAVHFTPPYMDVPADGAAACFTLVTSCFVKSLP